MSSLTIMKRALAMLPLGRNREQQPQSPILPRIPSAKRTISDLKDYGKVVEDILST